MLLRLLRRVGQRLHVALCTSHVARCMLHLAPASSARRSAPAPRDYMKTAAICKQTLRVGSILNEIGCYMQADFACGQYTIHENGHYTQADFACGRHTKRKRPLYYKFSRPKGASRPYISGGHVFPLPLIQDKGRRGAPEN